jgi:hypothetical protein
MLRTQLELAPWEIEVAFLTKCGFDPDQARTVMIHRWPLYGDLRPLEAAIVEGREIDRVVLDLLADMISSDTSRRGKPPPYRLKTVPLYKGRRKKPELFARRIIAELTYEHQTGKSDEKFERVARAFGTSDRTVRRDVTASRKYKRAK